LRFFSAEKIQRTAGLAPKNPKQNYHFFSNQLPLVFYIFAHERRLAQPLPVKINAT